MAERKFQYVWKEHCTAARHLLDTDDAVSAMEYLIGEKLMQFFETAATHPEFAQELPKFVSEVREIFDLDEIRLYLDYLQRMHALEDEVLESTGPLISDDDTEPFPETPEQRATARERFALLKELLTADVLGTS